MMMTVYVFIICLLEQYNHVLNVKLHPVGLNLFCSGIKYTEKDLVRRKVRHYPLMSVITYIRSVGTIIFG